MRKLKRIFMCLALTVMVFATCLIGQNYRVAEAANFNVSYNDFKTEINDIFSEICEYKDRIAGSDDEKQTAEFISDYLLENTSFTGKNSLTGIQSFKFLSDYTGLYCGSQNVIFEKKSTTKTDKKVVFTCSYDVPVKYDSENDKYISYGNDGLNASAANVASMLVFAKSFSNMEFDFNLEFVFFGASENSYAGTEFYLNGVSEDESDNILCVINIDKIAVGKNVYFYIDEVSTSFSKFVSKTSSGMIKQLSEVNVNKTSYYETNLDLGYSHIGLASANAKFMSRGITTINLFAGDYDEGLVMGRCEYLDKNNITYTVNDNLEYINKNYGENVVADNLYKVYSGIETLLSSKDFASEAAASAGATSWFYKIFANEKLVVYLTVVAFFAMIIAAMFIYYKLSIKAYNANFEVEFLSSVVKISDQVGEGAPIPDDVTKAVGQVLANDIKKDKTIKKGKKK